MTNNGSPADGGREFKFTEQDFHRVQKLIYHQAGISLSDGKQEMVYSRLSRRVRVTGAKTFEEYLNHLERNKGDSEWELFANALTTNLTSFFREPHHFPVLTDYMRQHRGQAHFNIWCSAASTGEEAYSIAMTVSDAFSTLRPPVSIIASDIDTKVLETAKAGVYPTSRTEKMDPDLVRRFFVKGGDVPEGEVKVRQELRDMIAFQRINLLDLLWPIHPPLDVIFCRNVMIYFDKPTQREILKKFVPLLRADGLLFAGHSESFYHATDYFKLMGRTVYELAPQIKEQRVAEGGRR